MLPKKKKNGGFIATSLIYSFFLVFALLMAAILATASENRILVNAIKKDIYDNLEAKSAYLVSSLQNKTYTVGESVSFAREDWLVVKDNSSTVTLIMTRGLTVQEMVNTVGRMGTTKNEYYGTCDATQEGKMQSKCLVRTCRSVTSNSTFGQEYCYFYNNNIYRMPSFLPTTAEINNQNYGQTITSKALLDWFSTHTGLQTVLKKEKLVAQTFTTNNGSIRYPKTYTNSSNERITQEIYVRFLKQDEIGSFVSKLPRPFHLLNIIDGKNSSVCNVSNAYQSVSVTTPAYILPVIEVKKG